ncbi:MAG: O-antigen ligase family protein [Endomicrobium sp.]|jgi:O-antigen ligase/tetratricopeptide (TPR) repeat protein|nr:O-antigen ligase family protein [Endomicrobium sp.]
MSSYSEILKIILRKTILYGLPVLYFLIAVSFYLRTYDSAQIKITLLHIGGLFLIMTWLILKIEEGNLSAIKKNFVFVIPIILFLLSGFFSFAFSPFKYASFNEFIKRFIYCGFAFIIISEFDDDNKILRIKNWLIAASYVVCLYGLLQIIDFAFFPPPPDAGLDPFAWRQAFANRIFSTFGNPNFFGDFLIVMNPITLAMYLYRRSFYLLFLWVLIVTCTVFTFSKGAWLAFAAGTFTFIVFYVSVFFRNKLNKKNLIYTAIIAVVVLGVAFFGIYHFSKKRMDSLSFRLFTWMSAWEMINTNPVLGTGIGSFYVTYPAWRRPQIFFIEGKHNTESDHPENEYLEVWFDEGIVGFTIFILLIIFIFTAGYKNISYLHSSKRTRDGPMAYLQLGVLAAFAAKLSHDAVCVSLRFVSSGVVLWLLIALTVTIAINSLGNRESFVEFKTGTARRVLKIVLQICLIVFFVYVMMFLSGYFKADLLHSKAIQASKSGGWDLALSTYEQVNKANPGFPMSLYFQGNVHLDRWKAGDSLKTESSFKKLWKIAPNYVQSKYLAGVMYSKLFDDYIKTRDEYANAGKSDEVISKQNAKIEEAFNNAVKYFNQYIAIDPIFPLTYHNLATLYARAGNYAKAEELLNEHINYPKNLSKHPHDFWVEDWALRRPYDYAETYSQLGNLYMLQDKVEEAQNAYLKAIELFPNHITARKNLALVYSRLGDGENHVKQWIEVYKIDPKDQDAVSYLLSIGVLKKEEQK